jgi:hypothetical protein
MGREKGKREKEKVSFEVKRKYLSSDGRGFMDVVIDGEHKRFEIVKKGRSITVDGVPLSELRLLFIDLDYNPKPLVERLKKEIYTLVNRMESSAHLQQYKFMDATLQLSSDGMVRLVRGGEELYRGSLDDAGELKLRLAEVARGCGLTEEEVAGEVARLFSVLERTARRLESVEVEGVEVRYSDGIYARQIYVAGDGAYIAVYLYGDWELELGIWVTGVKPIWLHSHGGRVEVAEFLPFFSSAGIIDVDLRVVRNVVLDVAEFRELMSTIDSINRGEAQPPSFREVWDDIERLLSTEMYIEGVELLKSVAYTEHTWFYDMLHICPQLAIVGPPGSGKTELRDRITALTRTIPLTQGSTLPSMRRLVNTLYPGLSFDEKIYMDPEFQSFLRVSNRKGSFITIADKEDPGKVYAYDPYGPRILTILPEVYQGLRADTLGRHVVVNMVRGQVPGRLTLSRELVWPIVKKLHLLLLYRWREYLEAWRVIDSQISRYITGHPRDIIPILLTPAYLAGKDKFEMLYEALVDEFAVKSTAMDGRQAYLLNGILRYIIEHEAIYGDNPPKTIQVSAKDIIIAMEGGYDDDRGEHRSMARSLGRILSNSLRSKAYPWLKGFAETATGNYYDVDVLVFLKYVSSYGFPLPEIVKEEGKKERLKKLGLRWGFGKPPQPMEVYEQIENARIPEMRETPVTPLTPDKTGEGIISPGEAWIEPKLDKPRGSLESGKKPAKSSAGVSGVTGITLENYTEKKFSSVGGDADIGVVPGMLRCDLCGCFFASENDLRSHVDACHKTGVTHGGG